MPEPVIFKDLPATFPEKDKYKKPSVIGSIVFHGLLVFVVIIVPLLMPQTIPERELIVTLVSPIGPPPPPPPPPPPVESPVITAPKAVQPQVRSVAPDALIAPVALPKEVVKIVEEPIVPAVGVIGGVPGGMPGGVLGGILAANAAPPPVLAPPPPPPPPPPTPPPQVAAPPAPIRIGGVVKEPQVIKMVPPMYPPLASRARVSGLVVLEATLTAQGSVEQIRVISGHPLLIDAAVECVKQWQYEPTYLNGTPVPVILTAKVHFNKAPVS